MQADINAIAIIYILFSTGFFILKYAELPVLSKAFFKHLFSNLFVLFSFIWIMNIYMFEDESYYFPLGQVILPILCHFFIIFFIPKIYKHNLIFLILTIFTIFVISFQYHILTKNPNSSGYTKSTPQIYDKIINIIKDKERAGRYILGGRTTYPPLYGFSIAGEYQANWLLDSELFYKLYDEAIKQRINFIYNEPYTLEEFKKFYRSSKIVVTPMWHTFFTGIYYYKKYNLEFWHKGGKVYTNNFELKVRE